MPSDAASPLPMPSPQPVPQHELRRSVSMGAIRLLLGRDVAGQPDQLPPAGQSGNPGTQAKVRLVLLSFLMLFVELALIRWLGANIVYLSYYSNFVLLGSFLGMGLGFLRARSRVNLFGWTPVALTLLVLFVQRFPVQISHTTGRQLIFFGALKTTGLPTWLMLPAIFLAVAAVMAMLGEGVARTFVRFSPLEAYRLDILGSICGIAAFSALSFFDAKPLAWGIITAAVLLVLYGRGIGLVPLAAVASLASLLMAQSLTSHDIWSPYYRITVGAETPAQTIPVMVNGIPHQAITAAVRRPSIFYRPYTQAPGNPLNNVLVIGAGTGNDVAGALRMGAKHVDAVEIDPMIYRLGRNLNTDHPYQSPRVSVHINDGRAFLSQTKRKYDLILFALPDSLTLVAGQSSLRLESYLFTLQAVQSARAHLVPRTGVFAMYNYYRTAWLKDRLANTLNVAYGHPPCINSVGLHQQQLSVLTISANPAAVACIRTWHRPAGVLPPSTDDHPFIYLASDTIPSFYLVTLALILLASALLVRGVAGPLRRRVPRGRRTGQAPKATAYADLFFMGAAFMLLETKSVVQFALLFGTTWFVNALMFAGVLVAVYLAVETTRWVRLPPRPVLYGALLCALAVAWIVPQSALLGLPVVPRFLAASALAFAPVYLANLVFAQRFAGVETAATAFAANLLGAMVGGTLEYLSLITGYQFLLIVVAVLYALAFITGRRRTSAQAVGT